MYLVFPKGLFSIDDLFGVRYMWIVCDEDKCRVVLTQRAADIRLVCLRWHALRAYCNFESKQANFGDANFIQPCANKPQMTFELLAFIE